MREIDPDLTTGLGGLDRLLTGLIPGDNVVWQVASLEDYVPFVKPCCRAALAAGRRLTYFRFARHPALVPVATGAEVHQLKPEAGFEAFVSERRHDMRRDGGRRVHPDVGEREGGSGHRRRPSQSHGGAPPRRRRAQRNGAQQQSQAPTRCRYTAAHSEERPAADHPIT